ncbi:MAG: hypothetical protein JSR63_08540 [Proteobacteria bacterium]|nr:hypothetical protein [Pseudomonadota bacterium]MBS0218219.1 hypothetical protein [Pseudomonadota bacterium]
MRIFPVLLLSLAIVACKPQPAISTNTPSPQGAPAATADAGHVAQSVHPTESDAAACPATDFNGFAEKFAGSISMQAKYTHWPLESASIDATATPEPKPVTKQVSEREMPYPLLMAFDRAKHEGQSVEVIQLPPDGAQIHYTKPDTDYSIRYLFRRQGTCWELVAIKDESL